jgi:hypothetical protein
MILSGEVPRVVNKWWHEEPFIVGNIVFLCRVCGPKSSFFLGLGVKLVSQYISVRTYPSYIVYVYPIPRSPQHIVEKFLTLSLMINSHCLFLKLMVTPTPMCRIAIW